MLEKKLDEILMAQDDITTVLSSAPKWKLNGSVELSAHDLRGLSNDIEMDPSRVP